VHRNLEAGLEGKLEELRCGLIALLMDPNSRRVPLLRAAAMTDVLWSKLGARDPPVFELISDDDRIHAAGAVRN
jgi:hypothetical protein